MASCAYPLDRRERVTAWAVFGGLSMLDVLIIATGLNQAPPADELMHLTTGFAVTWAVTGQLLGHVLVDDRRHRWLLVAVAFCIGTALGVLWEWAEWTIDALSGRSDLLKGLPDTLSDLVWDGIGAAAAGILLAARLRSA